MALFNSNGTYRKTQKSKLIQKLSLQSVHHEQAYIALIDIGMIWRMATPSAECWQTQDDTPYEWLAGMYLVTRSGDSSHPFVIFLQSGLASANVIILYRSFLDNY